MIQATIGCAVARPASGACPAASRIIGKGGNANPDFNMRFSSPIELGPVRFTGLVEWRKRGDVVNLANNYFDSSDLAADTAASRARLRTLNAGGTAHVENAGFAWEAQQRCGNDVMGGVIEVTTKK